MIHRKTILESKSADILFRIYSLCYEHNLLSDRGDNDTRPITKDDVPLDSTDILPKDSLCQEDTPMDETRVVLDCTDILPKDSLCQEDTPMDETRVVLDCTDVLPKDSLCQEDTPMDETQVVLDTQEDCLFDTQLDLAEPDHNVIGESIDPSVSFDVNDQDNLMDSMLSSSLPLPTDKDVEEGELLGDFMDFTPADFTGIESQLKNDKHLIPPLSTVAVEDAGKDTAGIVNSNTRSLVDYSELVVCGNSREPAKQATDVLGSDSSLRRSGRLDNSKTRNQDLVKPVKRRGPSSEDERACKKVKKLVDVTTCPENIISVGEHHEDASRKVVDASVNKDAANEKKSKRVVTQESKAKKKRNGRIKRAEERKKIGLNRPKLEIVVKEKKISICRHYMMGKCHEGDLCKFSHDSIPLTKSKPCCHFARHVCMKGDDCPYDHQLSKYPCNKLLSTGECDRGSRCLFSHEAQPIESTSDALSKSMPDQESPNSGSKRVDTKSCWTPKSVASNTERKPVDVTPKVLTRPPKGISFLSQNRSPIESRSSPNVASVVNVTPKTSSVTPDPKEITNTPRVVPTGINFLSFGKKPDLDSSNGRFSLKISNGIGKSPLGNLEGEGSKSVPAVNVVNGVKADLPADKPSSSQKPLPMMPFMSSTSQKSLQSTIAFASKFEARVKTNKPLNI